MIVKETKTGDLVLLNSSQAKSAKEALEKDGKSDKENMTLLEIPDPVFYCSIEPPSMSYEKKLDQALANLQREDPTFRVTVNPDTGQTVIAGMGELHIEIMRDRILNEYKVDADLGDLMIAYREAIANRVRKRSTFSRNISDQKFECSLDLEVIPRIAESHSSDEIQDIQKAMVPTLRKSQSKEAFETLKFIREPQMKTLTRGFLNALDSGPLLGYPVLNCDFKLHEAHIQRGTPETFVSAAMAHAVDSLLKDQSTQVRLLEPVMKLTITTEEDLWQTIQQDLLRRRVEIDGNPEMRGSLIVISAFAPLSELRGYSKHLRILSSGRANFGSEFSHYAEMSELNQNKVVEDVTGVVRE